MTGPVGPQPIAATGRRLDDADFTRAHLHGPSFEGARITDGWFLDADLSGYIDGLRVNGVEVAPLVEAELDRQFPERLLLRATEPVGLTAGWATIEAGWRATVGRASALAPARLTERVDGEWSFLETLRHLILATDRWHGRMILGEAHPYHPWGLAGSWLADPGSLGLDVHASPDLAQLLAVRREHMDAVSQTIATATPDELARVCTPSGAPGDPEEPRTVLACLHVILEEEWWHDRYANRDLDALGAPAGDGAGGH